MTETTAEPTAPKKNKVVKGCAIGCVVLFLLGVLVVGGGAFFGYRWVMNWVDDRIELYESQGFEVVKGQQLTITDPVDSKIVYVGQIVKLEADVSTDVAIIAQQAYVSGKIDGALHFSGQQLFFEPEAVVSGNLEVEFAQQVFLEGELSGEVKGTYQQLIDQRMNDHSAETSDDSP